MKFLIDTNILIYFFNGGLAPELRNKIEDILETSFVIAGISRIEFLGWKKLTDETKIQADLFLKFAKVLRMDGKTEDLAIQIRKNHSTHLPDAIIAATAIQHGITLVTRNIDDFARIPHLALYNPFEG
jgi:hypothetical protein